MKIYWIRAQAPRRVLAVAKHLGIKADYIEMGVNGEMKAPDYAKLNPNMKAPVLVDGDVVLWESAAINAWLCIKAGSDMWPANDPMEQVEVLRWLSWNDNHWFPANSQFYFELVVKPTFGFGTTDRTTLPPKLESFHRFAAVLNDHLAGKSYVALDRLTIADFQLASTAAYWRVSEMPMEGYANIVRWLDGLMELPAWQSPWPDREGDAFIPAREMAEA